MAFLLPLAASLIGSLIKGSENGIKKSKGRQLIMIHDNELVAPKKLAQKIRNDPKYKKEVNKLPKAPQNLSKADKAHLKKITKGGRYGIDNLAMTEAEKGIVSQQMGEMREAAAKKIQKIVRSQRDKPLEKKK